MIIIEKTGTTCDLSIPYIINIESVKCVLDSNFRVRIFYNFTYIYIYINIFYNNITIIYNLFIFLTGTEIRYASEKGFREYSK